MVCGGRGAGLPAGFGECADVYESGGVALAGEQLVHGQFFPARKHGPAVLVLPNWNAKWHGQVALCHWLQRMEFRR